MSSVAEASVRSRRMMIGLGLALIAVAALVGGLPPLDRSTLPGPPTSGSPAPVAGEDTESDVVDPVPAAVDAEAIAGPLRSAGYPGVAVAVGPGASAGRVAVTVSGTVPDEASRRLVLGIVGSFDGVDEVIDHLRVG